MVSRESIIKRNDNQSGSALLMTVFIIALLSIVVSGMLNVFSSDILIMQNHVDGAEAKMMGMAGLNDAFYELRQDREWDDGFTNKAFNGGTYSVDINNDEISVVGTTEKGFSASLVSEVTIGTMGPPYTIRQDSLLVNN